MCEEDEVLSRLLVESGPIPLLFQKGVGLMREWIRDGHGGILADQIGLRKSAQILYVLAQERLERGWGPFLIVAQNEKQRNHYLQIIQQFGCSQLVGKAFLPTDRDDLNNNVVYVTTYESLLMSIPKEHSLFSKIYSVVIYNGIPPNEKFSDSFAHISLTSVRFLTLDEPIHEDFGRIVRLLQLVLPAKYIRESSLKFDESNKMELLRRFYLCRTVVDSLVDEGREAAFTDDKELLAAAHRSCQSMLTMIFNSITKGSDRNASSIEFKEEWIKLEASVKVLLSSNSLSLENVFIDDSAVTSRADTPSSNGHTSQVIPHKRLSSGTGPSRHQKRQRFK